MRKNRSHIQKKITEIGKKIKEYRLKQNISQNQLAFESNITREYLGKIERGKANPSIETILLISEALDIDVKDFLI